MVEIDQQIIEDASPTTDFRILRQVVMHAVNSAGESAHFSSSYAAEAKNDDKLQQRWVIRRPSGEFIREEWRDVPIVTE